jgi:hypothetical protein
MPAISRRAIAHRTGAALPALLLAWLAAAAPAAAPDACCYDRLAAAAAASQGGDRATDGPSSDFQTYNSSGDPELDRFLGRALARLATTFKVHPGFAFYDGRADAFATDRTLLPDTRGTVLMKREFYTGKMRLPDHGMTVIAVCAHEFGHIYQYQHGYKDRLARLDRTHKPIELHADFLAGFFLALRKKDYPDLDLQSVGKTFYEFGDNDVDDRDHHGTSDERIAAVTAGYDFGRSGDHDIDEAAQAGAEWVARQP